jgi:hypothetical protein
MALPTNALATYQAIGNREDLSDMIWRIDPTDTPFMSGVDKVKATAVNHEWQTQALAAASGDERAARRRRHHGRRRDPDRSSRQHRPDQPQDRAVTGTQQAVDHAGRDDELAYQEMLKGLELKRDMETILLANQAKVTGDTTTARKLSSVLSWIKTNDRASAPRAWLRPLRAPTPALTARSAPSPKRS